MNRPSSKDKSQGPVAQLKRFQAKYEMLDIPLGQGHFSKVVLGRHRKSGISVAIKIVNRKTLSPKSLEKIYREVEILKSLSHPNIVQIHNFYETMKELYVICEYVAGGDLYQKIVIDQLEYTERTTQQVIKILASALYYCLQRGVIHRDIKPQNILLDDEGSLKLADFNLSVKVPPEIAFDNILEDSCGTLNYVAPEVLKQTEAFSYKCDVWSLGVVAFVLLTGGYTPFSLNNLSGKDKEKVKSMSKDEKKRIVQKLVMKGEWDFVPTEKWEHVSDLGKEFVKGMLNVDQETRFSYEDVLYHPWITSQSLPRQTINHEELDNEIKARRKALRMQKHQEAAQAFASALMTTHDDYDQIGEDEEIVKSALISGNGAFNNLTSLDDFLGF